MQQACNNGLHAKCTPTGCAGLRPCIRGPARHGRPHRSSNRPAPPTPTLPSTTPAQPQHLGPANRPCPFRYPPSSHTLQWHAPAPRHIPLRCAPVFSTHRDTDIWRAAAAAAAAVWWPWVWSPSLCVPCYCSAHQSEATPSTCSCWVWVVNLCWGCTLCRRQCMG